MMQYILFVDDCISDGGSDGAATGSRAKMKWSEERASIAEMHARAFCLQEQRGQLAAGRSKFQARQKKMPPRVLPLLCFSFIGKL
jgi:hypothetical protein